MIMAFSVGNFTISLPITNSHQHS